MTAREDQAFQDRLAAARNGDATAWVTLYHELAPLIIGYLRAQRLPDAEDVAGEVLLETVRDLGRFSGNAANLRSWVLSIAHHRLLDARRQQARRPVGSAPVDEVTAVVATDDPETETLAALGFGRLEPALAELTEEQRTVLLLRVIGDLPIAEVARITGKRPGAVKQLQRRAAEAMRRHLDAGAGGGAAGPSAARAVGAPGGAAAGAAGGRPDGAAAGPVGPAAGGPAGEPARGGPGAPRSFSARVPPARGRPPMDNGRAERTDTASPVSSARPSTLADRDGRRDER